MPQQTGKLDDRAMLFDALVSDKHEAGDYNIRQSECSNQQLLQVFQDNYRDEQRHVHMFMEAMTQRGWQTPIQADQQHISQVQNAGRQQESQISGTQIGGQIPFTQGGQTGFQPMRPS